MIANPVIKRRACVRGSIPAFSISKFIQVRISSEFTILFLALIKKSYSLLKPRDLVTWGVFVIRVRELSSDSPESMGLSHHNVRTCVDVWPLCWCGRGKTQSAFIVKHCVSPCAVGWAGPEKALRRCIRPRQVRAEKRKEEWRRAAIIWWNTYWLI